MSALELLEELRRAGILVKPAGDSQLKLSAPRGTLSPAVLSSVREHKNAILALLREQVGEEAHPGQQEQIKLFMATVNQWPPVIRRVWEQETDRMAAEYGVKRDMAELMAFNAITWGRVSLPHIIVAQNPDGSFPAWTGSLPGPFTWLYPRKPQQTAPTDKRKDDEQE